MIVGVVLLRCQWLFLLVCLLLKSMTMCHSFRLFGRRKSCAAYRFLVTLEQQVQLTDGQLRTARDEAAQLRNLLKLSGRQSRKASLEERMQLVSREAILKRELEQIKVYVEELEALRRDLEVMLRLEQERVQKLLKDLEDAKNDSAQAKRQYEQELHALQESLAKQTREKVQQLQALLLDNNKQVQDAIRQTKSQVEREYQVTMRHAVEKEQRKAELQLQQTKSQVESEYQEKIRHAVLAEQEKQELHLQRERQRLERAVEKERIKMRKLVKALATKEKKILAEAERKQQTPTGTRENSLLFSRRDQPPFGVVSPIKK